MKTIMKNNLLELITVSSLEKVFPDIPFEPVSRLTEDTMLLKEQYSFQAAYCLRADAAITDACVRLEGSLAGYVTIRKTGLVPSELPAYPDCDDYVLRTTPGLYPDPLYDFNGELKLIPGQWRSLWITIPAGSSLKSGDYDLTICFYDQKEPDLLLGNCTFRLHRMNTQLPPQKTMVTQWFHADCIADWYQVPVFGEEHWKLIETYMMCAASHGINMLLTPLFTPPLDTAVGKERTTVQLVDVLVTDNGYEFRFEKLERWLKLCEKCKIRYLEFSHLFTQWGAGHAPKIMAYHKESGSSSYIPTRIFGWETDAAGLEYAHFLDAFLPALMTFIQEHRLEKRCFFHVSDEPHKEHLPQYLRAKEIVRKHIGDLTIMDALSDYEYYSQGIVELPVCSSDHLEPFLKNQVPALWTYYCCGQYKEVANRFFCMPSLRNRILGVQMYRYQIQGFLQWGFNFWNSALSAEHINPFCVTDAGCSFPSGDAFAVYPGKEEPVCSLRLEVFLEALQDIRLFQFLEKLSDRENVCRLIDESLQPPLTFKCYPHDENWLLNLRHKCQNQIAELLKSSK